MKMPTGIPYIDTYKYTNRYEMAVSLFEACNMQCDFCFQNQDGQQEVVTPEMVFNAYPVVKEHLQNVIATRKVQAVDLKLWGGEILSDNLSDDVIKSYASFVTNLKDELSVPVTVVFLSNGLHTKYERIEKMINSLDVPLARIMLSYDAAGRFHHPAQLKLFIKTMNHYISKGIFGGLSIVLSKPSIEAYLTTDKVLTSLPSDIPICGNYYIANRMWPTYLPSWKDIFNFLKDCIEKKLFNVDIVENFFRGLIPTLQHTVARMCNCNEAAQYNSGDGYCSSNCINDRIRDIDLKKYFYGDICNEITDENQFFTRCYLLAKKNGCYTCEHFPYCTQMCGASVVFKEYDASECPLKKLHEIITEDDIANFKEYFYFRYNEKI